MGGSPEGLPFFVAYPIIITLRKGSSRLSTGFLMLGGIVVPAGGKGGLSWLLGLNSRSWQSIAGTAGSCQMAGVTVSNCRHMFKQF